MSFETDAILKLVNDISDIKGSQELILGALEAQHETLKLILKACDGDGSGELVAVLRKFTEALQGVAARMDALPAAVVNNLEINNLEIKG